MLEARFRNLKKRQKLLLALFIELIQLIQEDFKLFNTATITILRYIRIFILFLEIADIPLIALPVPQTQGAPANNQEHRAPANNQEQRAPANNQEQRAPANNQEQGAPANNQEHRAPANNQEQDPVALQEYQEPQNEKDRLIGDFLVNKNN